MVYMVCLMKYLQMGLIHVSGIARQPGGRGLGARYLIDVSQQLGLMHPILPVLDKRVG